MVVGVSLVAAAEPDVGVAVIDIDTDPDVCGAPDVLAGRGVAVVFWSVRELG